MNNDLNAENRKLRDSASAHDTEVKDLRANVAGMRNEKKTLVDKIKAKEQQANDATKLAKHLQAKIDQQARELLLQAWQANQRNADLAKATALASETANALHSSKEEVDRLKDVVDALSNDRLRLNNEIKHAACLMKGLEDHLRLKIKEIEELKQAAAKKSGMDSHEATRDTSDTSSGTRREKRDFVQTMETGFLDLLGTSDRRGRKEKAEQPVLTSIQAAQRWAASVSHQDADGAQQQSITLESITHGVMVGSAAAVAIYGLLRRLYYCS